MIRIRRTDCPSVLKKRPTSNTAYRNEEVVKKLAEMQFEKCCYSEMKIPPDGHGKAVEHFRPQSIFRGLQTQWDNLLLVCPNCNGKKSDKFPVMLTDDPGNTKVIYVKKRTKKTAAIINPADPKATPERELTYILRDPADFWYGHITPRNGSLKGKLTIEVTGIGDEFFRKRRRERLINCLLRTLCDLIQSRDNNDMEQLGVFRERFESYMRPQAPFAGLAREFARVYKLDKHFNVLIPSRDE